MRILDIDKALIYIYIYHIYDHFPEGLSLLLIQVGENVTVGILKKFEGHCQMVILKNRLVIVHQGQLGTCSKQIGCCDNPI